MARRLKTQQDLRRYLANLINRTEAGIIEIAVVGKLGYLASILTKIIENSDLEKRVVAIENELQRRRIGDGKKY